MVSLFYAPYLIIDTEGEILTKNTEVKVMVEKAAWIKTMLAM